MAVIAEYENAGAVPTLEAIDVSLHFGDTRAVDGMSFTLEGGKIYGLLGRNGSGKSTLLSVLAAFRPPTSGQVLLDGRPVFEEPSCTRQICLIREGGDLDSLDNVGDALDFASLSRPNWGGEYALSLLDRFRLQRKMGLSSLSRGQRAALAITLGLASRAPITMLDEAYLGLDAPSRYAFYDEVLKEFAERPRTFIISTHLIEEVANLFEEVVIIDKGKLLMHDSSDALRMLGCSITGPAEAVDRAVAGLTVLGVRQLGRTKSAVVFGGVTLDNPERDGLEISPMGLQDLFVHLTEPEELAS